MHWYARGSGLGIALLLVNLSELRQQGFSIRGPFDIVANSRKILFSNNLFVEEVWISEEGDEFRTLEIVRDLGDMMGVESQGILSQ